jgi:hypothetical protein
MPGKNKSQVGQTTSTKPSSGQTGSSTSNQPAPKQNTGQTPSSGTKK